MEKYNVYVGTKQSDIDLRDDFFDYCISYYGNQIDNGVVYCQNFRSDIHYETAFIEFLIKSMKQQIDKHPACQFIFYANKLAWKVLQYAPELTEYIGCLAPLTLLNALDNKIILRDWTQTYGAKFKHTILSKSQLCNLMDVDDGKTYIIQKSISAGGEGTYLCNEESFSAVLPQLPNDELYLVSPEIAGLSISCTIICHNNNIVVFPPNVQKSCCGQKTDYRILFQGSDFIEGAALSKKSKQKLYESAKKFGEMIVDMGYRGVCGIDYVLSESNSELYIIEVNPRFLGSTCLINKALADAKLPSLFYFHQLAFHDDPIPFTLCKAAEELYIPYYSRVVTNRGTYAKDYMKEVLASVDNNTTIFWDGFTPNELFRSELDAYLFRTCHYVRDKNREINDNPRLSIISLQHFPQNFNL